MRRSWKIVAASGALLVAGGARSATAQTGFEGVITYRTHEGGDKEHLMTMATKGNKLRIESGDSSTAGMGAMIWDGDAHTSTIIMPQRKMYMRSSTDQTMADIPGMAKKPDDTPAPKFDITKTGRTETVAGVNCDVYHGTSVTDGKTEEGELCVAKGVGFFMPGMMNGMGRRNPTEAQRYAALRQAFGENSGILKATKMVDGKPVVQLEATKIERKSLPDAVFEPPPDYTQFQMPQMGKKPT
jgi:uncharacterized protein DUF4412